MINKSVYYAHSKRIYDSKRESSERDFLVSLFEKVTCPNVDLGELGGIEPYLRIIAKHNVVVCSEFDGYIGRGVFAELTHAFKVGVRVYCLREVDGRLKVFNVESVTVNDRDDWKVKYGKVNTGEEVNLSEI